MIGSKLPLLAYRTGSSTHFAHIMQYGDFVSPLNLQVLEDRLKVTFKCGEGIDGDLCGVFFDGDGDFGWGIGNTGHVLLQPLERLFFFVLWIAAIIARWCTIPLDWRQVGKRPVPTNIKISQVPLGRDEWSGVIFQVSVCLLLGFASCSNGDDHLGYGHSQREKMPHP